MNIDNRTGRRAFLGTRASIGMTGQDKVAVVDLGKLEVVSTLETGDGLDGIAWVGR